MSVSGDSGGKLRPTGTYTVVESICAATWGGCLEVLLRQRITLLLGPQKLRIEVMTLRNYYAKSARAC
jgi:hypothetical protein